jgi:nitroreductase
MSAVSDLIRRRRSIFPKSYLPDAPIEREFIELLLENARWAPTHKRTEPWRFVVFHSAESRRELADYMAEAYRKNTAEAQFSEEKMEKMRENPLRAGAIIAICMQREAAESIPEFEEVAAVAMAVQNMWLTCTEAGIGAYWSTPGNILKADTFLGLEAGQRCLGLFYMGQHQMPEIPGVRGPIAEKTQWR